MHYLHCSFIVASVWTLLVACQSPREMEINVIPYPQWVQAGGKTVEYSLPLTFSVQMEPADEADLLAYLPDYALPMTPAAADPFVRIEVSPSWQMSASASGSLCGGNDVQASRLQADEGYLLRIADDGVLIRAATAAGAFYGLQTLAQLARDAAELPVLTIEDAPRFPYRGLHLDVSRHFFDKEHVKRQLDRIATYKMNRLHWHLTDGGGWRLEIPGYPELTEYAAWRKPADYLEWSRQPGGARFCRQDTPGAYGGYYTADDVREVVEYARLRHITVIPEIEMPGHSSEVLAAYPELSCTKRPYTSGEVCIGNEATFTFFENVLTEVMRLFPSRYIHIGGDEASRRHWKACPLCQGRMRREGLKDEAELQSYMIARIERFLNEHDRYIIGWDEILEGGLAPNATVMSWRSTEAGIRAARMGHDAIMTPEDYCYLDRYQDDPETQPLAFGSTIPLARVYSYNPVPDTLPADVARHVIGVQGNTWAEYIPTPEHAEYMIYPRIIALSEVGWTLPACKDEDSFRRRVNREVAYIRQLGYHPFPLSEQVQPVAEVDYANRCIRLSLTSERMPVHIRYTTDGTEPSATSLLYEEPLVVRDSLLLAARLFDGDKPLGNTLRLRSDYHKAIGAHVSYAPQGGYYTAKEAYKGGGDQALVDGKRGGKSYADGLWQGFCPNDLDVTIDLGQTYPVHRVMANFMQVKSPNVFLPESVEVWASEDGEDFTLLGIQTCPEDEAAKEVTYVDMGWTGAPVEARYVRYHARQTRGQFLFTDEIVVQ